VLLLLQVPFRLTRMMIKAMEVSGIEGNFRTTCEAVLRVLRQHKDSLMVRCMRRLLQCLSGISVHALQVLHICRSCVDKVLHACSTS
jgi:hypothetical protein